MTAWIRRLDHVRIPVVLAWAMGLIAAVAAVGWYQQVHGGRPRAPYSVVQFLLVCRDAKPGDHGVDARGIVTDLPVPSFPARIKLTVVVGVQPDMPGRVYRLSCFTAAGRQIVERELTVTTGPQQRSVLVTPLEFELEATGAIVFLVTSDGTALERRVVPILRDVPPTTSRSDAERSSKHDHQNKPQSEKQAQQQRHEQKQEI